MPGHKKSDGYKVLEDASTNPVEREFDERKYWRHPKVFKAITVGKLTVPEGEVADENNI